MSVDRPETHVTHCCLMHGCKYSYQLVGEVECPVESGEREQAYPCDMCESVSEIKAQIAELEADLAFAEKLEARRTEN